MNHRYDDPSYGRNDRRQEGSGGSRYGASGYGGYRGEGQFRPSRNEERDESQRSGFGETHTDEPRGDYRSSGWGDEQDFGASGDAGRGGRSYGGYGSSGDYGYGSERERYVGRDRYMPERGRHGGAERYGQYGQPSHRASYARGDYRPAQQTQRTYSSEQFGQSRDDSRYFGTGDYSSGGSSIAGGYSENLGGGRVWSGYSPEYGQSGSWRSGDYGAPRGYYGMQRYGQSRAGRMPRGPKGYQRSDERLKEDISERLMHAEYLDASDVSVNVVGGKVMLEGTVPDRWMRHAMEDLVDGCPGIQDIDNRVCVQRQTEQAPSRLEGQGQTSNGRSEAASSSSGSPSGAAGTGAGRSRKE